MRFFFYLSLGKDKFHEKTVCVFCQRMVGEKAKKEKKPKSLLIHGNVMHKKHNALPNPTKTKPHGREWKMMQFGCRPFFRHLLFVIHLMRFFFHFFSYLSPPSLSLWRSVSISNSNFIRSRATPIDAISWRCEFFFLCCISFPRSIGSRITVRTK